MAARRRGLYDVNSYIEVEIDFFDPTWRFQGNWFQIFFEFKNLSDEILIIELKDVQPGTPKGPLMTTPIILPEYHNWSFPLFIQFNQKKLPPFLKIMGILKGRTIKTNFKLNIDLPYNLPEQQYFHMYQKNQWTYETLVNEIRKNEYQWSFYFHVATFILHREGFENWLRFLKHAIDVEPKIKRKITHTLPRMFKNTIVGYKGAGKAITIQSKEQLDSYKAKLEEILEIPPPSNFEIIRSIEFEDLIFLDDARYRVKNIFKDDLGPWLLYLDSIETLRKYCTPLGEPYQKDVFYSRELEEKTDDVKDAISYAESISYKHLLKKIEAWEKAFTIAREKGSPFQQIYTTAFLNYTRGFLFLKVDPKQSVAAFRIANIAFRPLKMHKLRNWALSFYFEAQGRLYRKYRQHEKASELLKKAASFLNLSEFKQYIRNLLLKFDAHIDLAIAAAKKGDSATANVQLQRAYRIYTNLENENYPASSRLLKRYQTISKRITRIITPTEKQLTTG